MNKLKRLICRLVECNTVDYGKHIVETTEGRTTTYYKKCTRCGEKFRSGEHFQRILRGRMDKNDN